MRSHWGGTRFATSDNRSVLPTCNYRCPYVSRVPQNYPGTPIRSVRVPDELWDAVQQIAADRDETVTDVILRALERYVRVYGHDL